MLKYLTRWKPKPRVHYLIAAFCPLDYLVDIYLQKICKNYVRKMSMKQLQIQFLQLEKNYFSHWSSSFFLLFYVISVLTAVNERLIKQQCQYTVIFKCWISLSPHVSSLSTVFPAYFASPFIWMREGCTWGEWSKHFSALQPREKNLSPVLYICKRTRWKHLLLK